MKVEVWRPGTDKELDNLFEKLRLNQYQDSTHRYWKNYGENHFRNCVAYSLYFNDCGEAELCSSIAVKDCWPADVYRIMNRMWKVSEKRRTVLRSVSDSVSDTAFAQIKWLKENINYRLYFLSRQTENWQEWTATGLNSKIGTDLKYDKYKYLTCSNESDNSCWQKIVYAGDETVLTQWKRKCENC